MSAIRTYIFSINLCKVLVLLLVTRADLRLGAQILAYKGVMRKIFQDKELAELLRRETGLGTVAEFARMRWILRLWISQGKGYPSP